MITLFSDTILQFVILQFEIRPHSMQENKYYVLKAK